MIGLEVVVDPVSGSEAYKNRFMKGDFIVLVDKQNHPSVDDLIAHMKREAGKTLPMEILRDRKVIHKEVMAGSLGLQLNPEQLGDAFTQAKEMESQGSSVWDQIILTTAQKVEGKHVAETIKIVSSECVFGLHLFKDFFSSVRDVVGGRNAGFQDALKDAKETCLQELKREAAKLDADAVIAVDLDYSEISGGGKSMMFVVASGTAVRFKEGKKS